MLSPVFSTDSMRSLTPLFYEIANKVRSSRLCRLQDDFNAFAHRCTMSFTPG